MRDFLGKATGPLPGRTALGVEAHKLGLGILTPSLRYDSPAIFADCPDLLSFDDVWRFNRVLRISRDLLCLKACRRF